MSLEATLAAARAIYFDVGALFASAIVEPGDPAPCCRLLVAARVQRLTSIASVGEVIGVLNKRDRAKRTKGWSMDSVDVAFAARMVIKGVEIGEFRLVEPPDERPQFIVAMRDLGAVAADHGGFDAWHIAAIKNLEQVEGTRAVLLTLDSHLADVACGRGVDVVLAQQVNTETMVNELTSRGRWRV